jgi:predicted Zn finger-like uncharacterized protein
MIIECQNCKSTFEIDATLIKPSGSKVRCSVCKHTFIAQPSEPELFDESEINEEFQETLALDSSALSEQPSKGAEDATGDEFDKLFDDSIDEENIETITLDDAPEQKKEIEPFVEKAPEVQEELITMEDQEPEEKIRPEPTGPDETVSRKAQTSKSKPVFIIVLILILILCGLFSVRQWAPHLIPDSLSSLRPPQKEKTTDQGIRRLVFKGVNGSFVESDQLGRLFIIRGHIVNNYPNARASIQIKGSILDDVGANIQQETVYAGNSLPEEQLKKMTPEQFNNLIESQMGQSGVNSVIESDQSISFMIIFENLPDNMSEFTVEAVKSIPAK